MPTGYTSDIYEGREVHAKDFILKCARAFGATIDMRDEPLNKEIPVFKPSPYYSNSLDKAIEKLKYYQTMTIEEATVFAEEAYLDSVAVHYKRLETTRLLRKRYEDLLDEIDSWNHPTPDHLELKRFCIKQIKDSIKFDCDISFISPPIGKTPEEYIADGIKSAQSDIEYYTKEHKKEVERINERNRWVEELKSSL
ncbi:hypothetical protein [Paenibacillus polymyxa]|uniref:hypothetical protein n=1 Tax=Paenibacillus polymyxa TaxID=1406 RepID=UPI002AB55C44|nr:hypothetical protein [Paenibacillus polymyxa]MDY8021095.1 hypothetical protein [Paenibacillus polymyxa]